MAHPRLPRGKSPDGAPAGIRTTDIWYSRRAHYYINTGREAKIPTVPPLVFEPRTFGGRTNAEPWTPFKHEL